MTSTSERQGSTACGHPSPQDRLAALLDSASVEPLHPHDESGVIAVRGRVNGAPVTAYCTDANARGGSLGVTECQHIVDAIEAALREDCPVIGLWHSGGAQLSEGVASLDAVARVFAAMIKASGRVPQLSVILGPAAGGAAYGPALTDVIVMAPAGRVFVTGPGVVREVTGERIDMESLGGPDAHSKKSGVVHVVASSENDALRRARRITDLLASPGVFDPVSVSGPRDLRALLPDRARRAYDIKPLVQNVLDADNNDDPFEEFQPGWAPNVVVGLGRLAGHTVGVVASNPIRKGGCLDSAAAEKAARFVRMCDCFGVPLVVLVDVPGYLPGVGQEWGGVVRRGAKLLYAFAEAVVPRVTLVVRKCYGGAYIAMNCRALDATNVFAWPDAEVAVMGARAAVGILRRKELAALSEDQRDEVRERWVAEHEHTSGGIARALSLGVVDAVIDPTETRFVLAKALAAVPAKRGSHGNIPL
ncbi:acyl-CoA carboxylase subunit beta [Haloechinothrix halophila]|uniref:acyl-CoA carboxylase subunit beta n=1 Tax=Haloechinothrix halophila TaxID=1069073 RepID=UPI000557BBA0|nr:carboxyl transferase domain-containing protein [Haloechinothrix halophila]